MRNFAQWLMEMPMQLRKAGDWQTPPGPLNRSKLGYYGDDFGIMQRGVEKIRQKWEKVEQHFNTWAIRGKGTSRFFETGEVDAAWVEQNLKVKIVQNPQAPNEINIKPNSINYLVIGNRGAERMPLTAWNLAHRFGHAVHQMSKNPSYQYFYRELWTDLFRVVNEVYNKDLRMYSLTGADQNFMKEFVTAIGTMASARNRKIFRYTEFTYELIAQHIISEVKFNPLPRYIRYYNGRDRMYASVTKYQDVVDNNNDYMENIAEMVKYNVNQFLDECIGKIYVM